MSSDPERSKKAKKMAFFYLLFAILLYFFGIVNAIIIIVILAFSPRIIQYVNSRRGVAANGERAIRLNFGKIFIALLYLGIIFAVILAIATYLPPLLDKSLENRIYVKSQSGSGIVGYGENSIRLVGGNSKEGTVFTLKTTEPINGGPSFAAWITGTNNSIISIRMIDVKRIGANAEFKKIAISSKQFGYGVMYKTGYAYEEFSNGRIKTSMKPKAIDPHEDRREYDIEIEIYTPSGGIVDLEKVIIQSSW